MKLKNGVEVLKIFNSLGARNNIYPTVIYDKKNIVLVDTGYPGHYQIIKEQLDNIKLSINDVSKIILTHQDWDHMGSLVSILENKAEAQQIEVLAHEADKPYIEGSKTPLKFTDEFVKKLRKMVGEYSMSKQQELNHILDNFYVKVDKALKDGEVIDICGGIEVIHVPGHTPGNICLYLKKHKILLAGDALNITNGQLYGPDAIYTHDMEQAVNSLSKLTNYQIKTVVCYHGGVYDNNVNKRLEEIITGELNELATKKALR
jgi:glyoxylase-like metal-dependent hydrolase (beta-lactamase superfamily II)